MIFKCKICGGALELDGALSVAVCTYCGTKQTLPKLDDARRAALYDRANHFRRNNDFDKAAGIYEAILNEDATDAEAYWSIVLCRYGIEYVEDPATHKRVPTVNRAQYTSIFDDEDYKAALRYADAAQREVYEAEAKTVNEIQRGILALSQKEEPFDVFLSCKETDASGRRTPDSVLASEIYSELTAQGIRTFFARITLEDKLGSAYEPYIFAALHSAKVMVVVGTKPEHFNAVWVKNEWSRFLALIKGGEKKTVIPAFRDMDPYDLPDEFSHLQAQDMSKLGFLQDLVRGIKKILDADGSGASSPRETVIVAAPVAVEPLFRRAELALSDGAFEQADVFYEQILNQEPENADAYVGKLLAELRVKSRAELSACTVSFENSDAYKKAMRFGDDALKAELSDALRTVLSGIEKREKAAIYEKATVLFVRSKDLPSCTEAKRLFQSISGYRDADKCVSLCDEKIEKLKAEWEKLREEKRLAEEARRSRAKKAWKRALIVLLSLLLVAAITALTCLFVIGVAIPNAKYEKALDLIEEKRYDEAEELLDEAWYYAISKKTQDKLDRAYEALDAARAADEELEKAKQAEEGAVTEPNAELETAACEQAVRTFLQAGMNANVSFLCDGGVLPGNDPAESVEKEYASEEEFPGLPAPQKEGYRFTGWTCEGTEYLPGESRVRLILKAVWTEQKYVIRYQLGGGRGSNPASYGIEDAVTLTAPTKTGYTFIGWRGPDLAKPTEVVTIEKGSTGDRLYTAEWKANKYAVSFDPAGGTLNSPPNSFTFDSQASLPTPTRFGYTFLGWYWGTERVESGTWKYLSAITLQAKWRADAYAIHYELGRVPATNPNKMTFTVEDEVSLSNLSYNGCTFGGWFLDSAFTQPITTIPKGSAGDVMLFAKWTIHTYTIEYDWHGGNEVLSAKTSYTVFDLPITVSSIKPEKYRHKFYYWAKNELDGVPVQEISTVGNYRLVANYLPNGSKIEAVYGGTHSGYWFRYTFTDQGYANLTEIEIPKYHAEKSSHQTNPYLLDVTLEKSTSSSIHSLERVSFSDAVVTIADYCGVEKQTYENGAYLGSRTNPYYAFVGKVDPDLPFTTLHEDTELISNHALYGDLSISCIVIPKHVKAIDDGAFFDCWNLREVYNLSALNIKVNSTSDYGSVAWHARAVHTSLDEPSVLIRDGDFFFYYDESENAYYLDGYTGTDSVLTLPDDADGHPYRIPAYVFSHNYTVTSVTIPAGVVQVDRSAFAEIAVADVIFEVKTGWTSTNSSTGEIHVFDSSELSDPKAARALVANSSYYYYWGPMTRSE